MAVALSWRIGVRAGRSSVAVLLAAIALIGVTRAEPPPTSIRGTLTGKNIGKFTDFLSSRLRDNAQTCFDFKVKLDEPVSPSMLGADFAAFVSETGNLNILIAGEDSEGLHRSLYKFATKAFAERDGYAILVGSFRPAIGKCGADCVLFFMERRTLNCSMKAGKNSTLLPSG